MLIKYHDLETYYLNRRLELLQRFDTYAEQALYDDEVNTDSLQPVIEMLKHEYEDVIDPESLCETLKTIYPDELFRIEKRYSKSKRRGR